MQQMLCRLKRWNFMRWQCVQQQSDRAVESLVKMLETYISLVCLSMQTIEISFSRALLHRNLYLIFLFECIQLWVHWPSFFADIREFHTPWAINVHSYQKWLLFVCLCVCQLLLLFSVCACLFSLSGLCTIFQDLCNISKIWVLVP